jgi:hypothetical protein
MKLRVNAQVWLVLLAVVVFAATAYFMRTLGRFQPFADLTGADGGRSFTDRLGLSMANAVVQGHEGGRLRWRASADSITFSRDRRQVTVDRIRDGLLFDSSGKPLVRLAAGRAEYLSPGGSLVTGTGASLRVNGGIRAEILSRPGFSVETPALSWDGARNILRTDGKVIATLPHGAGQATGDSIEADTKTGNFSLTHLHGTFRVPPEMR